MIKAWLLDEMFRFDRRYLTAEEVRVSGAPGTPLLRRKTCLLHRLGWPLKLEMAG